MPSNKPSAYFPLQCTSVPVKVPRKVSEEKKCEIKKKEMEKADEEQ